MRHARRARRGGQRGFTLTELLVVVAIIGILAGLLFGLSGQTYGANAASVSKQIVGTLNMARMRAAATRRIHQVQFLPREIRVWEAQATGLGTPTFAATGLIETVTLSPSIRVWDVIAGSAATAPTAANTGLDYELRIFPDGRATPSTIFLADTGGARQARINVYAITGGSLAIPNWN